MPRDKSPLLIKTEYAFVRVIWEFFRIIPFSAAYFISRKALQLVLWTLIPKRKKIMETNLELCFPEKTMEERQKIAEQSVANMARGIALLPRLEKLGREDMNTWVQPVGFEYAAEALKKGNGLITIAAHYGLWEVMILYLNRYCTKTAGVARALDNPKINQLIHNLRTSNGSRVIYQHEVLKEGLRWLRQNNLLGLLIDQNFYKGGIFVDFFGRPAATTTIVSLFARRTGSPVLPIRSMWDGDKLKIIFEPPIALSQNPDAEAAIAEDTQKMAKIAEGWIRQEPGQWLWLHNRWKRKPEAGDVIYTPNAKTVQI